MPRSSLGLGSTEQQKPRRKDYTVLADTFCPDDDDDDDLHDSHQVLDDDDGGAYSPGKWPIETLINSRVASHTREDCQHTNEAGLGKEKAQAAREEKKKRYFGQGGEKKKGYSIGQSGGKGDTLLDRMGKVRYSIGHNRKNEILIGQIRMKRLLLE